MTYTDDEESAVGGNPVELYLFKGPGRTYAYTSHHEDISYDDETYVAVPMVRSAPKSITESDPPTLRLELPFDLPFVKAYAFGIAPTWATVTIRRYHLASGPDVGQTYFSGDVAGVQVSGRVAEVEIVTAAAKLEAPLPGILWQDRCQHVLYGSRCRVSPATFQVPTNVSFVFSIDATGTVIEVGTVDGIPDLNGDPTPTDYLAFGTIKRLADGESRTIISNDGLMNRTLTIQRPFAEIDPLDLIVIVAGCNRSLTACNERFNNVENFGGHPLLPAYDVFGRDLAEAFPPPT